MAVVTTQTAADVITSEAFPAVDAHGVARITYRQLDHWARQGWVQPSLASGQGRAGKRLYAEEDIVRLDLLRHLAMSKVNAAVAGPAVAELALPASLDADIRILWGPVGRNDPDDPPSLRIVDATNALRTLEEGGAFVVYNPAAVRARVDALRPSSSIAAGAHTADHAPTTTTRPTTTDSKPARRRTA